MKYAMVEDGIVTNIIVAEADVALDLGAMDFYDGCSMGEPYDPPTVEKRVINLETEKADKTEVEAVWESMAAAYQEGVQTA